MQSALFVFGTMAAFGQTDALNALQGRAHGKASLNPVTRVTELLTDLAKKVEEEGKTEEKLFKKFMCWGKGAVSSMTASNSAAQSRVDMLTAYISDIDAGRVEFTSERITLEKELEELNSGLEAASEMRTNEHNEFLDATEEMDKAINAIQRALDVLKEATAGHEQGSLLAVKGQSSVGFLARAAVGAQLQFAAELGDKFLTKGDAIFMRRLLVGGGQEPATRAEWKDLNRKADFKMSYKARSFKIQEVLSQLLQTFTKSKAEATSKENDAQTQYETLSGQKKIQKEAAETALGKMEKEMGARGMSRSEADEEVKDLQKQISDDARFIQETQASMDLKTLEWKDRSTLRSGELAAISKAISILRSDDARDLVKKSLASQGYSFLQLGQQSSQQIGSQRDTIATLLLRSAAHDRRVISLASSLQAGSHFSDVINAIDSMLALLTSEESMELSTKETCEKDRMDSTRATAKTSREMDEATDDIRRLQSEIAELNGEITQKTVEKDDNEQQLLIATNLRADTAAAYESAKKDDEDAHALIQSARNVLAKFYADNNLAFAQQEPGAAPVPPPATWEAPYAGKTGESVGILAILDMISDDILKDIAKADAEEAASIEEFKKLEGDITTTVNLLVSSISQLQGEVGTREGDISQLTGDRSNKGLFLKEVMADIKAKQPSCDYYLINYAVRTKNRQIEIDGLQRAKAILEGATFDKAPDESRELKPVDA